MEGSGGVGNPSKPREGGRSPLAALMGRFDGRMKKTRLNRLLLPVLLAAGLSCLILARLFDRREVQINSITCRAEAGAFVVSFSARNLTARHIRATARLTVLKLTGHGKGATTWDPVGSGSAVFVLEPKQTSEIRRTIRRNNLLTLGRGPLKQFQADVVVTNLESTNQALHGTAESGPEAAPGVP